MSANQGSEQTSSDNTAVRPFQVGFPEAELTSRMGDLAALLVEGAAVAVGG